MRQIQGWLQGVPKGRALLSRAVQPIASDDRFDDSIAAVDALMSDQGCAGFNPEECCEFWVSGDLVLLGLCVGALF
ncbi:hypothetical protein [Micromonospora sp. NPDC050276]|uniref:hypothetical protein n=1 Tax=Micromonospora sp. NPDC050276 TaxID=3364278 RepID=UPI00379EAD7C